MDVSSLLALTHTFAGTTSSQVSDVLVLSFLNLAYHEAEELIRNEVQEDYFYDYFTCDTKLNQSEYNFSTIAPDNDSVGILKVLSVGIKYSNDDETYLPVRASGSGSLTNTPEYLSTEQPQNNPFYIYKDNSLFIYPSPDNDGDDTLVDGDTVVTGGLRVHCSVSLIDLVAGGAETTIFIPRNHHKALALRAASYVYLHRNLGGTAIAQDCERKSLEAFESMKDNMQNRTLTPMDQEAPILTNLMY